MPADFGIVVVERGAQVGGQLENIRFAKRRMHGIKRREQLQPQRTLTGVLFLLLLGWRPPRKM